MKTLHAALGAIFLVLGGSSCTKPIEEKPVQLPSFTAVKAYGIGKLEMAGADVQSVKLIGTSRNMQKVKLAVANDTLFISRNGSESAAASVTVVLHAPHIAYAEMGDRVNGIFGNFGSSAQVQWKLRQRATLTAEANTTLMVAHAFDEAAISLNGNAKRVKLFTEGSGRISAFSVRAEISESIAQHSSRIETFAIRFLNASVSENARIYVRGNPEATATSELDKGQIIFQ